MATSNVVVQDYRIVAGEQLAIEFAYRSADNTFLVFSGGYGVRMGVIPSGQSVQLATNGNGRVTFSLHPAGDFSDGLGEREVARIVYPGATTATWSQGVGRYDVYLIEPTGEASRLYTGKIHVEVSDTL